METSADPGAVRFEVGAYPARAPVSGAVLFARYAFGPNRLGLCGPEDWRSMLELGIAGAAHGESGSDRLGRDDERTRADADIERGLRALAAGFEGAFPYLELIAQANGIDDPLDARVVEAYWIGSKYSDHVDPLLMTRSMDDRFRRQLGAAEWRWLQAKPEAGARPTHAFHVLDVFPRVGLARGSAVTDSLTLMDSCRIRWGRVIEVSGEQLVVEVVPLRIQDNELVLGVEERQVVRRWLDGAGFVTDVIAGDTVSIHWDWACEVLSAPRLRALQLRTMRAMGIASQTI